MPESRQLGTSIQIRLLILMVEYWVLAIGNSISGSLCLWDPTQLPTWQDWTQLPFWYNQPVDQIHLVKWSEVCLPYLKKRKNSCVIRGSIAGTRSFIIIVVPAVYNDN